MRKRARLQLRMLRDARDMKQVVPSSRTSRIANLKKLPLTERGLKNNSPLPHLGAKLKDSDTKSAATAAGAAGGHAAAIAATSTGRAALPGKVNDKPKHVSRHVPHVTPAASSGGGKQGGGVGVGIVFAHDADVGGHEVLSVKQFVK